jgi:hypothetical protein
VTPPTVDGDRGAIRSVLGRYRSAFNALDAAAATQVWPSVNERSLERAFAQLEQQNMSFDDCAIDVRGTRAEAACTGTAEFVPKVGSRTPQVQQRRWTFNLEKSGAGWQIAGVNAR